jgi:hypothetical protein
VTLNGQVSANAQSPLRAIGSGELVVRGLDALMREFGVTADQGRTPPPGGRAPPSGAGGTNQMLAMLSALGQQGTGPDGQPTRTYRFELTAEGRLMLNGTDMTALLGGATGARPAQTPAQPPTTPTPPGGKPPATATPTPPTQPPRPPTPPTQPPGGGKPSAQAPGGGKTPQAPPPAPPAQPRGK